MLKKTINQFYKKYKYLERKYFSFIGKFGLKSNQYYIVSFPKSGNTWIRIILSNILSIEKGRDIFLKEIQSFVPDSHIQTQIDEAGKSGSIFSSLNFQFIKSHDPYSDFFKDKNVIYIVRDGRDVLNSYFHYLNARHEKKVKMLDLIEHGSQFGFGSWSEHIKSWHNGQCSKFIVLRYEDLLQDTESEMKKLLKFIDFEVSDKILKTAVDNSKFEKLSSLEKKKGVAYNDKLKDKTSKFFRKGTSGDWKTSFSKEDLEHFVTLNDEAMKLCKYDFDINASEKNKK